MKKGIIHVLIICLSLTLLTGCGSSKKSDAELKAEVKAEQEDKTTEKTADNKEKVQVSTSGDLIFFNDDGSSRTLVKGSRGYQNMQSITFLENKKVIVLMASYGSSPLGVYTYKLNDDSFTVVTEPVKEYSIVDNTIKVGMPNGSIKYYDLNGYQVDQPGMSAPTTPNSEYEINKQYQFDFEGKGSLDIFSVDTDSMNNFDVIVNGIRYSIASDIFLPELVYYKYKLTEIADSGRYALTFFPAAPPHGAEVFFYEYTIGSGLDEIGVVYIESPDTDLFDVDIKDLTYNSVNINNQTHKFDRSLSR
ncbi:MAG TPA: hypothetical protein DEF42_05235 [Desulfosporosinus sp.]|nr:hypothetical protein [Desulfosporosinus sp.]